VWRWLCWAPLPHGMLGVTAATLAAATLAADPALLPPRSCAAPVPGHAQQSLYGKGVRSYHTLKHSSPAGCCQACAANASCEAWFAKVSPSPKPAFGECMLYGAAEAGRLSRGRCPGATPHRCFSDNWAQPAPPPPLPPPSPPPPPAPRPDVVLLRVSGTSTRRISPYLASMSIVYAWAPDRAGYANGTIGRWAARHHLNTARFPAGMAAYW
jgi:hypothetical protein